MGGRLLVLLCVPCLAGCSVIMALTGPGQVDTTDFAVGTPRAEIVEEYGGPECWMTQPDGTVEEIMILRSGDPLGTRIIRAVLYLGLDYLTLCLWEPVGMALETEQFDGLKWTANLSYDPELKLTRVLLKNEKDSIVFASRSEVAEAHEKP